MTFVSENRLPPNLIRTDSIIIFPHVPIFSRLNYSNGHNMAIILGETPRISGGKPQGRPPGTPGHPGAPRGIAGDFIREVCHQISCKMRMGLKHDHFDIGKPDDHLMITGWILAFSLYLTKPRKYESWWVVSQFQTIDGAFPKLLLVRPHPSSGGIWRESC